MLSTSPSARTGTHPVGTVREPADPPAVVDHGGRMLFAVSFGLLVVVVAATVALGTGQWWVIFPLMAVHLTVTAAVWVVVEHMLADEG